MRERVGSWGEGEGEGSNRSEDTQREDSVHDGHSRRVSPRETGEGWPLLTFQTEANGGLWSTNERCPSLVGSLGSSCRYKRFLCCLVAALVSPVQNIFFLPATWAGLRAGPPVSK